MELVRSEPEQNIHSRKPYMGEPSAVGHKTTSEAAAELVAPAKSVVEVAGVVVYHSTAEKQAAAVCMKLEVVVDAEVEYPWLEQLAEHECWHVYVEVEVVV